MSLPPLPSTIIPVKPRVHRKPRENRFGAPPASVTLITAVTLEDATTVVWHVSSIYSGDSACAALMVNDGVSGWVSPDAVDAPNETSIRGFYSGVSLSLASVWQLLTQIDGVTFDGGPLAVPQSGGVTG